MTGFDLAVRGGRAVLPGLGVQACDLGIAGGRIAAVLAPGAGIAAETLDATGLVVMPGAIDAHLHLGHGRDIARPQVPADADRESAAAAVGGITCFIPFLMATEPFEAIWEEVVAVTAAGARIDFGYHPIISTEAQLAGVGRYAAEFGAPSFKVFMNNRGGEGARLGLPDIDAGFLLRLCEAVAAAGGVVCPHPETIELSWVLRDRLKASDPEGRGGLATWNASRPPFVEADAVAHAGLVADVAGAGLHIVHCSSAMALEMALRHRRAGGRISVETCPHYLTHDVTWAGGDTGKINPPLREAADREALWNGLLSGDIDTVGTDHVHRDAAAKAGGIWAASPGCPGLETMLPVLLTEGHAKRGMGLDRIAAVTATNPAGIMGLDHRKGSIAVGLDADLAVVDPGARWTASGDEMISSAGYSIYDGWEMTGRVVHTLVRGRLVVRDGVPDDAAVGTGEYLRRTIRQR